MKLYFSWINENEDFDAALHAVTDGEILSFCLTEREGDFPLVQIEMSHACVDPLQPFQKQWCYISCDRGKGIEILFKGKMASMPDYANSQTVVLNFIAQPSDWEEQLQITHQSLKSSPYWDPLFVSKENQDDPLESLEARSELFFWCRKTGKVKLSDLFWGDHKADFTENYFYDSLKIRMGERPLSSVHVSLSVEWIQKYKGETDLSPLIRSRFKEGLINTLTGEDLKKKWWKTHEKIGKSGYQVARSSLKEVKPYWTDALKLYPALSDPFWLSPDDPVHEKAKPSQPQQMQLKRSWFRGELVLGWFYRQKRCEKMQFTLHHDIQCAALYGQRSRKLDFKLQNVVMADEAEVWHPQWNYSKGFRCLYKDHMYICTRKHLSAASFDEDQSYWLDAGKKTRIAFSSQQGCFFTTERGQKALEYALETARAHLAASARAIDVSVTGPVEHFIDLTCDHSVKMKDHRLPGNAVWGKVKKLKLWMNGTQGKQWGEMTLGVSVGTGKSIPKTTGQSPASYSMDYAEPSYEAETVRGYSPSGIEYHFSPVRTNHPKWFYPQCLTARDLVEEINVRHSASEQNQHLQSNQYPRSHNIEALLKEAPTSLHMRLLDLRPLGTLTEYIQVNIPASWSSPQQMTLTNSERDF